MTAKIALVLIVLLLAIAGWLLPNNVPFWATTLILALLVIGAVIQVYLIWRERSEARSRQYSGRIRRSPSDVVLSADDDVYPKLE